MSGDYLSKYVLPSIKEFATPEEILKLEDLDKVAERLRSKSNELEKERNTLRKNLKPNLLEEKKKFQDVRDMFLEVNSIEMRKLKKERKDIQEKFKISTEYIREARKKQLQENSELVENLKEKTLAWGNFRKVWKEFHNYVDELNKKYRKEEKE